MTDVSYPLADRQAVTACILSLASNYQPDFYLKQAVSQCEQLFPIQSCFASKVIINQDKNSAITKLLYHNQILFCYLSKPINYQDLIAQTKVIEAQLHRHNYSKPIITIDIDVLAVASLPISQVAFENNPDFALLDDALLYDMEAIKAKEKWFKILRRFPLPIYDRQGLDYLLHTTRLSPTLYQALLK